ncbi:MAG TPA: shikimate dehydrogenase [Chitinophagaceae bacterium]
MRVFGLIGKTLKHSFSRVYFTQKFVQLGLTDCRYENFEIPSIDDFKALLDSEPELEGLNITIPYKEAILPFLDRPMEVVREVGACNCIKFSGGKLYGFNTDVVGFRQSLQKVLLPHHTRALVLGTGGAAKAVHYALKELGITSAPVSRSPVEGGFTYEAITREVIEAHTLIVNTTPVGMYPRVDEAPSLSYEYMTPRHLLYDLTYNPAKTMFLQKGEERGARICNGQEMLELQAEESWRIWNSPLPF